MTEKGAAAWLSRRLGVDIAGIEKRVNGRTAYAVRLADGRALDCDAATLLSQARMRRLLFEATDLVIPAMIRMEWEAVRRAIGQAVREAK